MFMKVNKDAVQYAYGMKRDVDFTIDRLYLLEILVPGMGLVYKIGKASGKSSKDRMLQIVGSMFDVYRETPIVKIVRDRSCQDVFTKESACHRELKPHRIKVAKKWSGCTECFSVTKDVAIEVYERILNATEG